MTDNARTIDGDLVRIECALREYARMTNLELVSAEISQNSFGEKKLCVTFSFDPDPIYEFVIDVGVYYKKDDRVKCYLDFPSNSQGEDLLWCNGIEFPDGPTSNGLHYPGNWPDAFIDAYSDIGSWTRSLDDQYNKRMDLVEYFLHLVKVSARRRALNPVHRIASLEAEIAKLRKLIENRTCGVLNGQLIDDGAVKRMVIEAEAGYDIDSLQGNKKEKEQRNDN